MAEVMPGQTVKVEWPIMAPNKSGSYQEHFALVAENLTWISGSDLDIPIVVSAPVAVIGQVSGSTMTPEANSITTASIIPAESYTQPNSGFIAKLIRYANYFYLVIFFLLSIALLLTMFIRWRIQHAPTLFRAVLVIVLAGLIFLTKVHFMDVFANNVKLF
jgi:hypothetical protein